MTNSPLALSAQASSLGRTLLTTLPRRSLAIAFDSPDHRLVDPDVPVDPV